MSADLSKRPLGRNKPPDFRHLALYPLKDQPPAKPTPVIVGLSWMEGQDNPVLGKDGRWRPSSNTGQSRGGHCYCLEPPGEPDTEASWVFYDQGETPSCEGHGHSRAMSLLLPGAHFDAFWLYDDARRIEGAYPEGEGSTNRSAAAALQKWGDHPEGGTYEVAEAWRMGDPARGIASYRWTTDVQEIWQALGYPGSVSEVPMLNSWGKAGYPHRVYLSAEFLAARLAEEGEGECLVMAP